MCIRDRYVGPVDDRTRDECLFMASADRLTESEIISQFGAAVLVDGGGINCRHKWEIASEEGTKFHEGKQAQQAIKKQQTTNLGKTIKQVKPKYIQDLTKPQFEKYWVMAKARSAGKITQAEFDLGLKEIIG